MVLHDSSVQHPVDETRIRHRAHMFTAVEETFRLGEAQQPLRRDFIKHLGAVAVLPVDDQGRVLLIRQYRHPVRMYLWEIPAGLLDTNGETLLDTARRELHEEADMRAATWHTLLDFFPSPGGSDEAIRLFLARDLSAVDQAELHTRDAEEAEINIVWVPLEDAVSAALAGTMHNPTAVAGVLALHAVRTGAGTLRDARAPWDSQPRGIAP